MQCDGATSLCWGEDGKPGLSCIDLATSAVTTSSTGALPVNAVVGDATNHYFFTRAPGSAAFEHLFDAYRVAK